MRCCSLCLFQDNIAEELYCADFFNIESQEQIKLDLGGMKLNLAKRIEVEENSIKLGEPARYFSSESVPCFSNDVRQELKSEEKCCWICTATGA